MSTTVTNSSGVQTRQKLRSTSEQLRPMSEMMGAIDNLASKRRGATRRTLPVRTSPDVEELPTSPLGEVFSESEPIAAQIWNEMFQGNAFLRLTEKSDYMRRIIPNLLDPSQLEKIRTEVMENIDRKRATFISTEENDANKLREKLHKLFTTILIRGVKDELAEKKRIIEDKVAEMVANRVKRSNALSWYMEKQRISRSSVAKAAEALTDLLESATHYLDQEDLDENALPGNRREILSYMVEFLTEESENNTLGLPEIIDAERDPANQRAIYREEFDGLPQEVREKFHYVEQLITQANEADMEERREAEKHRELLGDTDDEAIFEDIYNQEHRKLDSIYIQQKVQQKK